MVKQIDYVACPLCGANRVLYPHSGVRSWLRQNVSGMDFIQVREGGGRAMGFHKVGQMTMREVVNHGSVDQMNNLSQMVVQLMDVVKEVHSLGLISDKDLLKMVKKTP